METNVSIFGIVDFNLHGAAAIIVIAIFGALFLSAFIATCCCMFGSSCPKPWRWRRNRRSSYTTTIATSRVTTSATPATSRATASASTATSTTCTNSATTITSNGSSSTSAELNPSVLGSISSFVYAATAHGEKLECAVCSLNFNDGENGRRLEMCGHSFHAECTNKWFKYHSTCPVCRSNVDVDELPV